MHCLAGQLSWRAGKPGSVCQGQGLAAVCPEWLPLRHVDQLDQQSPKTICLKTACNPFRSFRWLRGKNTAAQSHCGPCSLEQLSSWTWGGGASPRRAPPAQGWFS